MPDHVTVTIILQLCNPGLLELAVARILLDSVSNKHVGLLHPFVLTTNAQLTGFETRSSTG